MNKLWNSIITSLARLLLGFCLVVGLSALTAGLVGTAHADSPIVITTCDEATLGNAFYNAPSGATIEFACSGSIQDLGELFPRPGTSLTLDASGQQVTIEGNGVEPVMTVSGGHLTLINLTIADGYGYDDFHGGGLNTIGADVTIRNSTFLHNAGREGGAIAMEGGSLSISNSTFANNSAPFGGGGLYSTSAASITNSTFVGNSGGAIQAESNVSMSGSIVANNTPKNCFHAVIDQGYNLESGTDCDFSASTDLQNTDPKLAPLSDNGGSAQRLALLDGSPAINHGGSSCPAIDQRGITRPQGPPAISGPSSSASPRSTCRPVLSWLTRPAHRGPA